VAGDSEVDTTAPTTSMQTAPVVDPVDVSFVLELNDRNTLSALATVTSPATVTLHIGFGEAGGALNRSTTLYDTSWWSHVGW